jgi:protein Mpv17
LFLSLRLEKENTLRRQQITLDDTHLSEASANMSKSSRPTAHSPSSKLLRVTLEGAGMSAVSNTLAQGFNAYKQGFSVVDPVAFVHFVILAIITTPPNYKWQLWLEETFPSHPEKPEPKANGKKKDDEKVKKEQHAPLSIPNTIIKFVLDQTCGAAFNTVWFIVMINLLRGQSINHIITTVQNVSVLDLLFSAVVLLEFLSLRLNQDFVPMIMAGYTFWPIITLVNLVLVPFDYRMLVGGLAGLVWGMYISLTQL